MIICVSDFEKLRSGRTLRKFCADYGLPESDIAHLSRILTGKPVSIATQRRIGRAIGVLKPPHRDGRRAMTEAQAASWDKLTQEERNERMGV